MIPDAAKEYIPGKNYIIIVDDAELSRLNTVHRFSLSTVYENRLVYDRSINLSPGQRVLDSGTGTGTWLMQLSEEVPESVLLYGIDVAVLSFPKSSPPNVSFQVASASKLPEIWTSYFDLINQRFLMAALISSEWPVVLTELFRVLKPGGHLQIVEGHLSDMVNCGPAIIRLAKLHEELMERRKMLPGGCTLLPQMLKVAGFVDIVAHRKYVPIGRAGGDLGQLGREVLTDVFQKTLPALVESRVVESVAAYNVLMKAAESEYECPEAMSIAYWMFCARKPI